MTVSPTVRQQDERPLHRELIERARALQPLLRRNAAEGELLRRLPESVNEALTEAGMFRLLTPTRFGGYAVDLRTAMKIAETLGEADGSASWLVSIGSTAAWMLGHHSSPQAQKEIFGRGPDVRAAGSNAPGAARPAKGGLYIRGRWSYASGAYHADWAVLAALPADGAAMFCIVPAKELLLKKTWYTVGMRATGSDTWLADDVFVPDYRTIPMSAVTDETPRAAGDESMLRLPFASVAALLLVGPLLGIGRAALNFVIEQAPAKSMHGTFFVRQSESVGVQIQIAEAALALRTARLHAYDIATTLDDAAAEEQLVTYAARAQIRAQLGYVAQQVLDAISTLVNVHGSAGFAESSRLQQYWRDANTAARHATLQPVVGYEVYGKSLLAIDERISPAV